MSSTVMNHERGTVTRNGMYQKLIVFIQALAAIGILVIAGITWIGQSTSELRIEMREEFRAFRAEMREEFRAFSTAMREEHAAIRAEMGKEHAAIRTELHEINTRLGRVEGEVRTLTQGQTVR